MSSKAMVSRMPGLHQLGERLGADRVEQRVADRAVTSRMPGSESGG